MLHLYLLRHAKAIKFSDESTDFQRHLNKQGSAQANVIGHILRGRNFRPGQIISSSATRTRETAEIVKYHTKGPSISFYDDLFLADKKLILQKICADGAYDNLLYVGHNNGISDLAGWLTNRSIILSTCQMAVITFNFEKWEMISAGTGTLNEIITPDVLTF